MNKKYQIRKCEKITIWRATQVIELDPEDFRDYEDCPYTGNSEEEFVKYINQFTYDTPYDDIFAPLREIDEDPEWDEYASSLDKSEESWLEIGEVDENYRKTGGFNCRHDTWT